MATVELEGTTQAQFDAAQRRFSEVVAKFYGDPEFRAKVEANPTEVLKAEGVYVPEGRPVKLLINTEKLMHIILPPKKAH